MRNAYDKSKEMFTACRWCGIKMIRCENVKSGVSLQKNGNQKDGASDRPIFYTEGEMRIWRIII